MYSCVAMIQITTTLSVCFRTRLKKLYFFQIVKERKNSDLEKTKPKPDGLRLNFWWRMTGSNRRPPACKAGALPAELIPHLGDANNLVGLVGLEPTTPALSTRCSNQLSYSPDKTVLYLFNSR